MIQPGMVLGVDRDYVDVNGTRTGLVRALLQTGEEVEACYAGVPPWPLATALFDGPGEWFCLGPIGDRRLVAHDDFLFGRTAGGAEATGEGGWYSTTSGSVTAGWLTDPTGGAAGVYRAALAGGGSQLHRLNKLDRQVTLDSDIAWHLSARVRYDNAADGLITVGLADMGAHPIDFGGAASTDAVALITLGPVGQTYLTTAKGTGQTDLSIPEEPAADTWTWLDLVVVGGQWAAGWAGGSGPWVVETNVPDTSVRAVTPVFMARNPGQGATNVDIDCISLAAVSPVNTPDDVAIPAVPFL